jgi:hypothetical protein
VAPDPIVASARMLETMSKPKRRPSTRTNHPQSDRRPAPAEPPVQVEQDSPVSPSQVLERIKYVRVALQHAEAELAALVDHAVGLGIGWPEMAAQLGVTRQAARQHYQRRHRDHAIRQDRMA